MIMVFHWIFNLLHKSYQLVINITINKSLILINSNLFYYYPCFWGYYSAWLLALSNNYIFRSLTQLCKNVRISEKYKSHIYGGELLKNFYIKVAVLVCLVPIITSCESFSPIILGKPTDSSEINKWSPPTEKEFFQRRKKQKILDDLEKNLEERFLLQENLDDEERALLASLRITKKQLSSIEPAVQKKIDNFKSYFKE